MNKHARLKKSQGVLSPEVDGQAVLMHVERGFYYGLNNVGALVWRELEGEASLSDLCSAVMSEFDVEAEECEHDLKDLLAELSEKGLVEPADTSE